MRRHFYEMKIWIDTREQRPWTFPDGVDTEIATLKQGDYSLAHDGTFSIERKSLKDFRGTVVQHWDRFVKELHRMDECGNPHKVIIVEGNIEDYFYKDVGDEISIPDAGDDPVFTPQMACERVAELTVVHRTAVLFARDEGTAAALAYHIFLKRLMQLNGRIK